MPRRSFISTRAVSLLRGLRECSASRWGRPQKQLVLARDMRGRCSFLLGRSAAPVRLGNQGALRRRRCHQEMDLEALSDYFSPVRAGARPSPQRASPAGARLSSMPPAS